MASVTPDLRLASQLQINATAPWQYYVSLPTEELVCLHAKTVYTCMATHMSIILTGLTVGGLTQW